MSTITISFNFLQFGVVFSLVYIGFRFLGMVVKLPIGEGWLALFKTCSYGLLALFIYKYCTAKHLTEVPVVDAFTFILCCLECSGNFIVFLESIKKYFSPIFSLFRNEKDDYLR